MKIFIAVCILLALVVSAHSKKDPYSLWRDAVDDAKRGDWRECGEDSKKAAEKSWDETKKKADKTWDETKKTAERTWDESKGSWSRWKPSNLLPSWLRPSDDEEYRNRWDDQNRGWFDRDHDDHSRSWLNRDDDRGKSWFGGDRDDRGKSWFGGDRDDRGKSWFGGDRDDHSKSWFGRDRDDRSRSWLSRDRDDSGSWWGDWKDNFPSLHIPSSLSNWREPDWFKMQRSSAYAVDLWEDDKSLHLHAELPGMKMESIKLEVEGKTLILTADREEKVENKDEKNKEWISRERYSGNYKRKFVLPETVLLENAKATYKDGILEVTIPKIETKKTTIPISRLEMTPKQ